MLDLRGYLKPRDSAYSKAASYASAPATVAIGSAVEARLRVKGNSASLVAPKKTLAHPPAWNSATAADGIALTNSTGQLAGWWWGVCPPPGGAGGGGIVGGTAGGVVG